MGFAIALHLAGWRCFLAVEVWPGDWQFGKDGNAVSCGPLMLGWDRA